MLIDVLVILFGLAVGSFLNVCIHRLPREESVIVPPSRCPNCGEKIRPWHNIPVLSYLLLKGRCARCGEGIGWTYPLVEILTALLVYLAFWRFGLSPAFALNALFFCLLIVLVFIDLFERILPNVITLGGAMLGLALAPLQSPDFFGGFGAASSGSQWLHYLGSVLGILAGAGILWLVAWLYLVVRKVEGMGFGDVKMMGMVGAFLGWQMAWLTIFLGSFLGAIIGSFFIYASRRSRSYELPFGTFLGGGAVIATLWGPSLARWYLSTLR